jgi:GT2 family glycosyltransferase
MPRVAVQIVTYNSSQTIEDCLAALTQQRGDWSALVVDNASTDDTPQRVNRWNLPLHVNQDNIGYAAAHNQAFKSIHSDYVLTLNPDVTLEPDFIVNMCAILDTYPEVGMAAGCLLRVDRLGDTPYAVDGAGVFLRRNRRQGLRAEGIPALQAPKNMAQVFGVDGAAAFYRRVMLEDVALDGQVFDEDFFMHKEDIDLCWRAQWRGWQAYYVPNAIAHHIRTFRPGKRERVSSRLKRLAVRNRYAMMLKNDHIELIRRDLFPILIYEIGIWGYILLRERESLCVLLELWREREQWLRKRRLIQQSRKVEPEELKHWFTEQEAELP